MYRSPLTLLALIVAGWTFAAELQAADSIRRVGSKSAMNGEIKQITTTEVTIATKTKEETIPVNELELVRFDGEPSQLNTARSALRENRINDAQKALDRIKDTDIEREDLKADLAFYKALTSATAALQSGDNLQEAGKAMSAFVKQHPTSFHYFQAQETMGDLLVALASYDKAVDAYGTVEEKAPWADFKMRAGIAKGRALLRQGKGAEALPLFEKALSLAAGQEGDQIETQKLMAEEGQGEALALSGKSDEAVALLKQVIDRASPELSELHALAHNALGTAHLKAGRKKEARFAFMYTHMLYSGVPDAHAEALSNLVKLDTELGNKERAATLQAVLEERYAKSRWAQK